MSTERVYCKVCDSPLEREWVDDGADEETGKQQGHYETAPCEYCESGEGEEEEEEEEEDEEDDIE